MSFIYLSSVSDVAKYIGYVLLAVLVLLVMITVHEFGHYITGKIFKFGIEEFSIGFGPKLYSKKKKDGEIFSVRALPLGGYCAFTGEDAETDDVNAFTNKPAWQRIIVLISGAFMNYLLALVVIMLMFGIYGQLTLVSVYTEPSPTIPVEYCLNDYDVLIKADGKNVYMVTDLMNAVSDKKAGDTVDFTVLRNGEIKNVDIILRTDTDFKNMENVNKLYEALGIKYEMNENGEITSCGLYSTSVKLNFFRTLGRSFDYSFKLAKTVFQVFGELLTGRIGINSMGGTVTTISVAADAIKIGGFRYLLNITAFIGVNLAVFNLFPVPALDGSRVVFCLIELIFRKPVNRKIENVVHTIGFILILLFAIFVDLQQCF